MTNQGKQSGLTPRTCAVCGVSYQPYRDYQLACSRNCRVKLPQNAAVARAYHADPANKERKNAARRVDVNPARRDVNRKWALRKYGLTVEQYDAMFTAQNGQCAICYSEADPNGKRAASRLHVDHDHISGRVRALLCNNCNRAIGYLKDDPDLMAAAAEYVRSHRD